MKKLLLILIIPFLSFGQTPITQANIYDAVWMWEGDSTLAEAIYGHISNWDVSNVTSMVALFSNSSINPEISNWDVSNVTEMTGMFSVSQFNKNISNWDVGNVVNMDLMFYDSVFDQDIGDWDVSNVFGMVDMFYDSVFDQDIGDWDVSNVVSFSDMFGNSQLSIANYDSLLIGWSNLNLIPSTFFSAGLSQYCDGGIARTYIINTFNWTINDGGPLSFSDCQINVNIDESSISNKLIKTIDILGREANNNEGFQLQIYDDGSVEKKYLIK